MNDAILFTKIVVETFIGVMLCVFGLAVVVAGIWGTKDAPKDGNKTDL